MPNLPLDANDEDLIQRGLRRPSLDEDLLPLNSTFTAVRASYDNSAPGLVSTDNIWTQRAAEELAALSTTQRREYLEQRGLIPPADAIPYDQTISGLDDVLAELGTPVEDRLAALNNTLDQALSTPIDSYGQSLNGPTTQPRPITAPSPGGSVTTVGTQPSQGSRNVYTYTPIDLYDDRYDFATGQIIRKGIATGAKGGTGQEEGSTIGPVGLSDSQSETPQVPPSISPNDTSTEQYDDAILREARQEENAPQGTASQGTATSRLDGKDGDLYSPKPEGRLSNRLDSKGETPPPPPPPKLSSKLDTKGSHRASRQEIIASRRQSGSDIRFARANGETLVRHRRPDGTYYAGPPKNVSNKRLPQRARDMGF